MILSDPEEITTMTGQKLPLKMSVDYISFSAHTDYEQTSEFIRMLRPPHVVRILTTMPALRKWIATPNSSIQVIVHGEQNEMQRLKSGLERQYENDPDTKITVHNPKNTMSVDLYFAGEKTVKVSFAQVHSSELETILSERMTIKVISILGCGCAGHW